MKSVLLTMLIIVSCNRANSQVDTIYSFFPELIKHGEFNNFDSTCINNTCIAFEKEDTANWKNIRVRIYQKGRKRMEGSYLLDTIKYKNGLVISRNTGSATKELREVNMVFVRNGYWFFYKKMRVKQIYYDKGVKLKLRIND